MTLVYILNYTIPIAFMIFLGFWLDRMLKPSQLPETQAAPEFHQDQLLETGGPAIKYE